MGVTLNKIPAVTAHSPAGQLVNQVHVAPVYYAASYLPYTPLHYYTAGRYGYPHVQPTVIEPSFNSEDAPELELVQGVSSVPVSSQHHAQSESGEYEYGYTNA